MDRKHCLFNWSEVGEEQVGVIQNLPTICPLYGIKSGTYLVDVLQRTALHPTRDVTVLTPRCWKERFAGNPMS